MASNEGGNLWFLQPPTADGGPNQQTAPPPPPQQQIYQSPNPTNPFNSFTQSSPQQDGSAYAAPQPGNMQQPYPPPQGPPYAQQQGGPFPPPQYTSQPGTPYQQQGYPEQAYTQSQQRQFFDPNPQVGGEAASFYNTGPPPVTQPGQGPGGPGDRGFFDNAMQMAGVQQPPPGPDGMERGWLSSSKNPLDPPPKMFRRPAPGHYSYARFQPMSVLAVSDKLQDGFALMPPVSSPGEAHPFVSHDITEDDWHKFLKDFQKTAHLSTADRLFHNMGNSFMKDKITSDKVQKRIADNKLEPIGDYLMAWNHYFFRPRRMTVVLAKGNQRFSGESDDYPPDVARSSKSKKSSKDKKSYSSSRSVTAAEPYPRGTLLGGILGSVHKSLSDTTTAATKAHTDLLRGVTPGMGELHGSRSLRYSDEESESSEEYSESEEESDDDDPIRASQRKAERGITAAHRKAEADLKAAHEMAAAHRGALLITGAGRRAEKDIRREEKRAQRELRKANRLVERQARKYGGLHDTGRGESKKHKKKESDVEVPSGRFRLVNCFWDGQREVY